MRLVVGLIVAGIVVLAALSAYSLLKARSELNAGITQLDNARAVLQLSRVKTDPSGALNTAAVDVQAAHSDFGQASNRVAPFGPLLEHLSWVPRVGLDLAAAPSLAATANDVTGGMAPLLGGLQPLAASFGAGHATGTPLASRLTTLLAAQHSQFATACNDFGQAANERRAVPRTLSVRAANAVHTLDVELPNLRTLCRGLMVAPSLLGYRHPTTYLIAYEDEMELRSTGGFIGSAGIVTVNNGVAHQRYQSVVAPLENVSLQAPEPVVYYNQERWLFRDSNWAADFPTTAALERFFYNLDFHHDPPNVIDITADGAAALLQGTGPIYVPEYKQWVNAGNVGELADYYAHWAPTVPPLIPQEGGSNGQAAAAADARRKQFIQIVATLVLQRLQHLSAGQIMSLGQGIAEAVSEKGILVHFANRQAQALADATNASGRINPTTHDYLYVVDTNLSYNKINPYVRIGYRDAVTIRPDRWLDVRLTIHLRNGPLPARLVNKGIGPGAGLIGPPSEYADYIRVYAPNGAQLIDQSGWTNPWTPGNVYGKTMFDGYILVPDGQSRTIHLHYVVPANVFSGSSATYRLVVQHQPGAHPASIRVRVHDDASGRTRRWTLLKPSRDWSASMPVKALPFSTIPLPASPLHPVVAPGRWIEPHDYLGRPKNIVRLANG